MDDDTSYAEEGEEDSDHDHSHGERVGFVHRVEIVKGALNDWERMSVAPWLMRAFRGYRHREGMQTPRTLGMVLKSMN